MVFLLIGKYIDPLWYGDWCVIGNLIDPLWYGEVNQWMEVSVVYVVIGLIIDWLLGW